MSITPARATLLPRLRENAHSAVAVIVFWWCLMVGAPSVVQADIRLPKIFSDSMVLQRQADVHLNGTASPDEPLVLLITGTGTENRELKTVCDAKGEFSLKFAPPPVGGPYELTLSGKTSKVVIRDVLVGDVWLCAGQSNMAWPIQKTLPEEIAATQTPRPQLRLLTVPQTASPQPLNDVNGSVAWSLSTPESAAEFSAVAWHFGSGLEQELQVPIGLIHASWGGTKAESWLSREALASDPSLKSLLDTAEVLSENGKPQDQLGSLYNGMIAPLRDFPIKGAIWYQGEANVGRGQQYGTLLPLLIRDWRQQWKSPLLPFLFVQLAPFRYKSHSPDALPELWDAQLNTCKTVPRTGMAVITDAGNVDDVHPVQKLKAGRRLSAWALAEIYHGRRLIHFESTAEEIGTREPATPTQQVPIQSLGTGAPSHVDLYSGPLFRAAKMNERHAVVEFYAAQGLRSADGQPLREFLLAGEDHVFHPATAVIEEDRVVVTCDKVQRPVAVRFCWNDTPNANLVNAADLPASPFRSDSLPFPSAK